MNASQMAAWLQNMAAGVRDIPGILADEVDAVLPEIQAATPVRSGEFQRSWRVEVSPEQDRIYLTARARRKGRPYTGVVRAKGTEYVAGPQGGRLGGHWADPPLYLQIVRKPLEQVVERVQAQITNLTQPYIPLQAPERD